MQGSRYESPSMDRTTVKCRRSSVAISGDAESAMTSPQTGCDVAYFSAPDRFRVQLAMNEIASSANETASSQFPIAANAMAATANPMPAYRRFLVCEAFTPGV